MGWLTKTGCGIEDLKKSKPKLNLKWPDQRHKANKKMQKRDCNEKCSTNMKPCFMKLYTQRWLRYLGAEQQNQKPSAEAGTSSLWFAWRDFWTLSHFCINERSQSRPIKHCLQANCVKIWRNNEFNFKKYTPSKTLQKFCKVLAPSLSARNLQGSNAETAFAERRWAVHRTNNAIAVNFKNFSKESSIFKLIFKNVQTCSICHFENSQYWNIAFTPWPQHDQKLASHNGLVVFLLGWHSFDILTCKRAWKNCVCSQGSTLL